MQHSRPSSPELEPSPKRVRPSIAFPSSIERFFIDSESSSEDDCDEVLGLLNAAPEATSLSIPENVQGDVQDAQSEPDEGYASDGSTESSRVVLRKLFPEAIVFPDTEGQGTVEAVADNANNADSTADTVDTVETLTLNAISFNGWGDWKRDMAHIDLRRLQTLLDNKDPPRGRYSLANLPTDVHWNNKLLFDENAMCEVVAIGVLEDTMFTSSRHAEFQRSWITIHLLRDIDCAGVDRIANLANPVRRRSTRYIRAIYQPAQNRSTILFPYVYDAAVETKAGMPRINVSDLVIGDIVLVEGLSATSDREQLWEGATDDATLSTQTWVPTTAFIRLRRLTEHTCVERHEYSLGNLPAVARWGEGKYSSYITVPETEEQVPNLWAIGHLTSVLYAASETEPRPRLRIQLDLVRQVDRDRVNAVLNMATDDAGTSLSPITITELDNMTLNKMSPANKTGFREVFDATDGYTKKANMPRLSITDLMIGDLVLVECTAIRCKHDKKPPQQWDHWVAGFQFHAILILYRRSETVAPPPCFFPDDFEGYL